jgi:hypothetical protein
VRERRVIDKLGAMGIKTLADFEKIIPSNSKERYLKLPKSKYGTYATGIVLWTKMCTKIDSFFPPTMDRRLYSPLLFTSRHLRC